MPIDTGDTDDRARHGATLLLARAAASIGRADRALPQAIDDLFLDDDVRLDDRTRATVTLTLRAMVAAVERDLRGRAAGTEDGSTFERLSAAGLLRDPALVREAIDRARLDIIADTLDHAAPDEPGAASLLVRLAGSADARVAGAAVALMATEARRRSFLDSGNLEQTELPAELHHHLVWLVAAAIHAPSSDAQAGRAIADAAARALASHDEGDCVEGAAVRLAIAIDPQPTELPALLVRSLGDRHVALFVALLASALRIDFAAARGLVVSRGEPLWLGLRAIDLDRATMARIGVALSDDVESFADQLDAIMAVDATAARAAIAPLSLPAEFRAAIAALATAR